MEIGTLFSSSLTPSQVYNEFLRNLQSNAENILNFHLKKADRSKGPIRKYFNVLNIATRNLEVKMVLKFSIKLKKELMS